VINPLRILLIDDNPDDRTIVMRELRREFSNLQVKQLTEREGFAKALKEGAFDLVITDYQIRWTDGLTVLGTVKCFWPDCPVIMFTATGSEEIAVQAMKAGLSDYVLKSPEHFIRLPAAVRSAVERAASDRRAARLETRLESLLNRLNVGVFRSTTDGRLVEANPALLRLLGLISLEEAKALNLQEFGLWPKDRSTLLDQLKETGPIRGQEVQLLRKDGSRTWVSLTHSLGTTGNGEPVIDSLAEDITDRKRMEEEKTVLEAQLRQAQKMEAIGQLASGVAHDFNNLLTVITGYCELLLPRLGQDDSLRQEIELIRHAGERSALLTRQLLTFARRQAIAPDVLNLNALVSNLGKMLKRLMGEDITLTLKLNPELGNVKADPGQIEQAIMNLAVNARDAMPSGGHLTIETANVELDDAYTFTHISVRPGPYVMLAVNDTGIGMDAETQSHLFEPFFTTKDPDKGTGLGLSTVYGIVKQSGGNIWVYSELGLGSTFKVYLPLVEDAITADARRRDRVESPHGWETVLLVEDAEMVRSLARTILVSHGYTVLEAWDGNEALRIAQEYDHPIHLLMTDVVMPGMNGQTLAERLASIRPTTKVLYMSGYTGNAITRQGLPDPGVNYLQKPFTPTVLARTVRDVLDSPLVQTVHSPR